MARFCASCGTEVDETAVFCPTCGQPIDAAAETEMPAAPAWPDPAIGDLAEPSLNRGGEPEPFGSDDPAVLPPVDAAPDAPTWIADRPPDAGGAMPGPRTDRVGAADGPSRGGAGAPQLNLPVTMPVTLSAWLIGVGAGVAAIGLLIIGIGGVLNVIDLLLFLALLGVAATVFFSARLPAVPHLRLATLVIALIAFGVALDRVGFRGGSIGELLFFLGTAAAAIGAIILEMGRDQPLGGSTS